MQLDQINRYLASRITGLQAGWIGAASIATMMKLVFFCGSCLVLLSLVGAMLVCAFRRS